MIRIIVAQRAAHALAAATPARPAIVIWNAVTPGLGLAILSMKHAYG